VLNTPLGIRTNVGLAIASVRNKARLIDQLQDKCGVARVFKRAKIQAIRRVHGRLKPIRKEAPYNVRQ